MGSIFHAIGDACTNFFKIMPLIGRGMNYFIIFAVTIGVFYWIYYMMKDPNSDENFLSK